MRRATATAHEVHRDRDARGVVPLLRRDPNDDGRRCTSPNRHHRGMPRSERSFVVQRFLQRAARSCSCRRLLRGDLGVMSSAQHLEPTLAVRIRFEMVVTTRPVPSAIAWFDVVDLAISTCCVAPLSRAAVLRPTFGGRTSETPDVIALPSPPTRVAAPRTPTCCNDHEVAPLAASRFAAPCREVARDSFGDERR